MRGIKIPQYEFALKMQGGLMREGGRICGTLRYMDILLVYIYVIWIYCKTLLLLYTAHLSLCSS